MKHTIIYICLIRSLLNVVNPFSQYDPSHFSDWVCNMTHIADNCIVNKKTQATAKHQCLFSLSLIFFDHQYRITDVCQTLNHRVITAIKYRTLTLIDGGGSHDAVYLDMITDLFETIVWQ